MSQVVQPALHLARHMQAPPVTAHACLLPKARSPWFAADGTLLAHSAGIIHSHAAGGAVDALLVARRALACKEEGRRPSRKGASQLSAQLCADEPHGRASRATSSSQPSDSAQDTAGCASSPRPQTGENWLTGQMVQLVAPAGE